MDEYRDKIQNLLLNESIKFAEGNNDLRDLVATIQEGGHSIQARMPFEHRPLGMVWGYRPIVEHQTRLYVPDADVNPGLHSPFSRERSSWKVEQLGIQSGRTNLGSVVLFIEVDPVDRTQVQVAIDRQTMIDRGSTLVEFTVR